MLFLWVLPGLACIGLIDLTFRALRQRGLGRWIVPYLRQVPRRRTPRTDDDVHVLLCIADHFEPRAEGAGTDQAASRVQCWLENYPRQFGDFRDSDGRPPRHTFFYPIEQYEPVHLDALAELCRAGYGEVEVHLHPQN